MFHDEHTLPIVAAPDLFYARPLLADLEHRRDFALELLPQDAIAEALSTGRCACGLVSPTALLRNANLSVLPGAGVAATRSTPSERLITSVPLDRIRTIAVTPGAAPLEDYLRVLYAERGIPAPAFLPASAPASDSADATLASGDTTPMGDEEYVDIGKLWKETTGLPMVLAVWACGPRSPYRMLRQTLAEAARRGVEERAAHGSDAPEEDTGESLNRSHYYFQVLSQESDSIRALHEGARRHAISETIVESIAFC